jgi:hypothetical protein
MLRADSTDIGFKILIDDVGDDTDTWSRVQLTSDDWQPHAGPHRISHTPAHTGLDHQWKFSRKKNYVG